MHTRENPIQRPAGRVVLADANDRILLIRIEDLSIDEPVLWITPGGACEGSETPARAAVRELQEETGIQVTDVGPCVWRRRHVWRWGDRWIDSLEHFHFLRIESPPEITYTGESEQELSVMREFRWWSVANLKNAADAVFVPRRLPDLLPTLLSGDPPAEPIEVGV